MTLVKVYCHYDTLSCVDCPPQQERFCPGWPDLFLTLTAEPCDTSYISSAGICFAVTVERHLI